jgi:hypothetical protein
MYYAQLAWIIVELSKLIQMSENIVYRVISDNVHCGRQCRVSLQHGNTNNGFILFVAARSLEFTCG